MSPVGESYALDREAQDGHERLRVARSARREPCEVTVQRVVDIRRREGQVDRERRPGVGRRARGGGLEEARGERVPAVRRAARSRRPPRGRRTGRTGRAQAVSVSARLTRPSPRHDARITSPIGVPTTVGRPVSSARRPATSPRIPTGHGPRRASPARRARRATAIAGASSVGTSSSACWPGAWPGSGMPNAARASAIAVRIRSRRVVFAASRVAASSAACSGVSASSSRAASRASPTRPAALSRGRDDEAHRLEVDRHPIARPPPRSSSAAIPGRGFVRIRSSPSFAIARFSPRTGATSETVPIVARSARSSASRLRVRPARRSSSRATVNATPLPDRCVTGSAESARCGFTSAIAAGSTSGRWWWSVTIDVDAALAGGGDLRDARGPRVDGDDQRHSALGRGGDRGQREAVALLEPRRHVRDRVDPQPAEGEDELREAR